MSNNHSFLVIFALLSLVVSALVAAETCPATGIHGMPGVPGMPGRDGRDGEKGDKGEPGASGFPSAGPVRGQKGDPGLMGYPGKRGASGGPGDSGKPGSPGAIGEPGDPGTVGVQLQAAFSVARVTDVHPLKNIAIKFSRIITNINEDYDTQTGHFRCRVAGTYYFVYHASLDDRLCVLMKLNEALLTSFCDHRRNRRQVTSGSLAVYLSVGQEVWLETKDYNGMKGSLAGNSVFSGFLLHAH